MLNQAIALASTAHAGQMDKAGKPYILHPLRVMLACDGGEQMICAVLHDVVEDTAVTMDQLKALGYSENILAALECLTKRKSEDYESFIGRVLGNRIACHVKLADLKDNMDLARIATPGPEDYARIEKYKRGYERIQSVISP